MPNTRKMREQMASGVQYVVTHALVDAVVEKTYGTSKMTLATHLTNRIRDYAGEDDARGGREYMMMRVLWDWMTGGSTAAAAAAELEAALRREGI